jgi:class 3 adenylate cyclase
MADHMEHATEVGRMSTHALPAGTITLLFTDIEKSTHLLQQPGNRYASVLDEYRHLLRMAFQQWSGHEVYTQGDAFFAVFARATDAVEAAVAAQRSLTTYQWSEGIVPRVRMGLHTGEPEHSSVGYTGLDVQYADRLMSAAHGGQVILSQTTRELVAHNLPEGVSLRDVGEHLLEDFRGLKHFFQVVIADLPADYPPLRTLDARFNNLPAHLTSLIGREQEVAAVCTLLKRVDVRLVTLTGTGGIGKTRLGLAAATELLDNFAYGVCFVPLASINDPTLVVPTIARLLGLEHSHTGSRSALADMEYLKAFLQDKRFLLVLDNFEQVALAAPDLTVLLETCPHLNWYTRLVGATFVPTLTLATSTWTGNSRLFEVIFVVLWYIGAINHLPLLDIMGVTGTAVAMRIPLAYGIAAVGLLFLTFVGRQRQLQV